MSLLEKLVALGFEPLTDFNLQDDSDGMGPYIRAWRSTAPQPTQAEIDQVVPSPPPHRVYQQTLWSRTNADEAVALKTALDQAEIKFQMLFSSSDFFGSDHPMFALLHWTIAVALATEDGPNVARADELLGPPTVQEAAALAPETA